MANGLRTKIVLDGVKELARFLEELPARVSKKAVRQAVGAGSTPMLKSARKKAPKRRGVLKKALKRKIKLYPSGNAVALVGVDKDVVDQSGGRRQIPNKYLHLVIQGTKPHGYKKREGQHPGSRANDFIADAFNETKAEAGRLMEQKLGEVLQKEAAKLAAKG